MWNPTVTTTRRTRLHAEAQVLLRTRDPRTQQTHCTSLQPLRKRLSTNVHHPTKLGCTRKLLDYRTDRNDRMRARYVAMANGPLSRPKLPGIQGINDYKGHTFHTSRWDYNYTGGDSFGNLSGLKDKRVGIIGTGATAVQCIPHLGEWANSCMFFSAHLRQLMNATITRPIKTGPRT